MITSCVKVAACVPGSSPDLRSGWSVVEVVEESRSSIGGIAQTASETLAVQSGVAGVMVHTTAVGEAL